MNRSVRSREGWRRRSIDPGSVLLAAWSLFIVYGTMLPFDFAPDLAEAARKARGLGEALGRSTSRSDVVSNLLLFAPWGFLASWHLAGRGRGLAMTLVAATLGGLALSASVECGQLFLPSRTASLVDLATNTFGAALGASLGWPMSRRARPHGSPILSDFVARRPLAACALAGGAGLVLAGLSPFEVSIDAGDLKSAIKAARPIPFGPPMRGPAPPAEPWAWAREGMSWMLAGGMVALALGEAGRRGRRAVVASTALCGGLALLIEALQIAIPGRVADSTSVVFATIGSAAGASIVASSPGRDPRRWAGPGLTAWALAELLASWTPPHLLPPDRCSPRWSQLVPFWAYYQHTDAYALADLLSQVLGFVPLGALLAARGARRSARWALGLGLGLGCVLEAGQILLADRTADITDVISAGLGAALGARAWAEIAARRLLGRDEGKPGSPG